MLDFRWSRMLAVAERDLRRFRRNSTLMIPMAMMPIIYLVILGKAMGGDLHDLRIALVDQDHGSAAVTVRDRLTTLQESRHLFRISSEPSPAAAVDRLRQGAYKAVVVVPPRFSEDLARGESAPLGLVLDNTDNTSANAIEGVLRGTFGAALLRPGTVAARIDVQRVDVYGHKEFMQYLVPAVIALALFFVAMLAGGIILVDDRAKGVHEGYFVTPLSALDIVLGLTLSATTLAMFIGGLVLVASIVLARLPIIGGMETIALTLLAIFLLSIGLILFMFTLMARVSNPLTPRAMFGILNVLTFFPSGALYPTESYPGWLNAISAAFPMRYAVHSLRNLLLKGVGFQAVLSDFLVMAGFALLMLVLAVTLFKRTL